MSDNYPPESSDSFNEFFSMLQIDRKKSLPFIKGTRVSSTRKIKRLNRMSRRCVLSGGCENHSLEIQIVLISSSCSIIAHIERSGLKDEGLYRKTPRPLSTDQNSSIYASPTPSAINRAPSPLLLSRRSDYTRMFDLLKKSFDCRTASVLVRVILKSLQLELLSADHQSSLVRLLESWDRSAIGDIITSVRRCIKMGESRTDTLGLVCTHLSHVLEQSDFNKTDITLLISSFGRVLGLRSRLLRFFVTNASNVFSEFTAVSLAEYDETMARSKQEKYPPLSTDDVRRLRSELSRKESLLSILLDEVKSTDETPEASKNDKDELLWTIQREVTEIKRKLKRSGSEQNNLCLLLGESSNDQQVKQARSRFELSIALGKELLSELRSIHSRMVCMKNARAHAISDGMSISSAEDLSSIDVNNPSALIDALRKAVQESYAIKFRLAGVKNRVATEQDRIRRLKIQRAQTAAMANLKDDDVD